MEKGTAEELLWCSNCCRNVRVISSNEYTMKSCSFCGKVLSDGVLTAEEYDQLHQILILGNRRRLRRSTVRSIQMRLAGTRL